MKVIKKAGDDHAIEDLVLPRELEMADSLCVASLVWIKVMNVYTELQIRYGSSLTHSGVRFAFPTRLSANHFSEDPF